jgi:hypothetical protein
MNFGELKDLVKSYLHRTDLDANIPHFVTMAQARINRDLNVHEMETRAIIDTVSGNRYISLPAGMKALLSVHLVTSSGREPLQVLSPSQMAMRSGTVGQPWWYSAYNDSLELSPAPDDIYSVEITYRGAFPLFVADADTNDLLNRNFSIFVYASMLEASPFIHADERVPTWKAYYEAEVIQLNDEAENRASSGGPMQILSLGGSTP